ncbi:MAG: hypothetical protein LC126_26895 [Bryobacterales bacterium]|nr:hypothetical protein [Bryobacterales bacterium]
MQKGLEAAHGPDDGGGSKVSLSGSDFQAVGFGIPKRIRRVRGLAAGDEEVAAEVRA